MNSNILRVVTMAVLCGICWDASAQKRRKNERFFDVTISPSLGFRVMGSYKIPDSYTGTLNEYSDSLNKADRPGQNVNLGIQQMWKKNAFDAFSLGLSYTTTSFRRVNNDVGLGDTIHPEVGIISNVVQAGFLQIKYDYRYHHLELPIMWHRSAEGYGNLRDFDMWYSFGVAPAVVLKDRVNIRTVGFSYNGTNKFEVQDRYLKAMPVNVFAHAAFRAEYHLYHKIHGLFQPRLRVPLLPSTTGLQTIWIPQFSIDLGLIYLIDKEKDNKAK